MSTIYTTSRLAKFKALTDDFEAAIRRDERQRLLAKFRGEFPVTGSNTDMHGQPLQESGQQRDDVLTVRLNSTQKKMLEFLRAGYIAVPTLAGNLRVRKETVYAYLWQLKKAGYQIDKRNTGNHRGGYAKIYRLAKAA